MQFHDPFMMVWWAQRIGDRWWRIGLVMDMRRKETPARSVLVDYTHSSYSALSTLLMEYGTWNEKRTVIFSYSRSIIPDFLILVSLHSLYFMQAIVFRFFSLLLSLVSWDSYIRWLFITMNPMAMIVEWWMLNFAFDANCDRSAIDVSWIQCELMLSDSIHD